MAKWQKHVTTIPQFMKSHGAPKPASTAVDVSTASVNVKKAGQEGTFNQIV